MIKVTIKTDADFTPAGKRTARTVMLNQGPRIRWYVSGRIYNTLPSTPENSALTKEWIEAQP